MHAPFQSRSHVMEASHIESIAVNMQLYQTEYSIMHGLWFAVYHRQSSIRSRFSMSILQRIERKWTINNIIKKTQKSTKAVEYTGVYIVIKGTRPKYFSLQAPLYPELKSTGVPGVFTLWRIVERLREGIGGGQGHNSIP